MNHPRIQPINPTRLAAPFDHPEWLFELKHDGYRAVAYIEDGKCELVSRKGNLFKRFGALTEALASEICVKNAIIDGEIVCLDGEGRSLFLELLRHRRADPVFYAFDLVWDGADLRILKLIERKRRLRKLIRACRYASLLFADHIAPEYSNTIRPIHHSGVAVWNASTIRPSWALLVSGGTPWGRPTSAITPSGSQR